MICQAGGAEPARAPAAWRSRGRFSPRRQGHHLNCSGFAGPAIAGPRSENRPLENTVEHGRQSEADAEIDRYLHRDGAPGEVRCDNHRDAEVEQIERVRDASEEGAACGQPGAALDGIRAE